MCVCVLLARHICYHEVTGCHVYYEDESNWHFYPVKPGHKLDEQHIDAMFASQLPITQTQFLNLSVAAHVCLRNKLRGPRACAVHWHISCNNIYVCHITKNQRTICNADGHTARWAGCCHEPAKSKHRPTSHRFCRLRSDSVRFILDGALPNNQVSP